jgi:hypothetical protein
MTQSEAWSTIPSLVSVARLRVSLARPLTIARTARGLREVIPITGGLVDGAVLRGRVLPGGADWCLTRDDGVAEVWARYTIEAEGGILVMVTNSGLARPVDDGSYVGRTVPRFEVADGPLGFLRDHLFIGALSAPAEGLFVDLEFFRVD